ncbi:TonB-dependent receptor plug domain-containing protein [Maribacter algicola]|uniref:TonB-dependent receptor plug domain-containing protein n=1 Tax=Meishania litoralis TaxID=3434685 RepID=A0ACC7LG39_9FLAO
MKTLYKFVGIAIVCLFALQAFKRIPQENILLQNIISKLLIYNTNEGPEKTYLHTDKDFYTNGETIWFKTYLVDGITHTKSDKSKVIYVELVNPQDSIIAKRKLYVNTLGASGDIELDNDIPQGNYYLRAYTKYMLNENEPVIFQKKIPIVVQRIRTNVVLDGLTGTNLKNNTVQDAHLSKSFGKPHVRFFPEGGQLVEGINTILGIEVSDTKGNGIALKGYIEDGKGNKVKPFESQEFGLGKVNFRPEPNTDYYASVVLNGVEEKFPLPRAEDIGYGLSIKNRGDHLLLQVSSNTEEGVAGTLLIGHLRGKLIFNRVGKTADKQSYGVKLFNKELLDGVAQFTLFGPNGEPVCERLTFVDNPYNDVKLSLSTNDNIYGAREKVDLNMLLTNSNGVPLSGELSLGVVTKNSQLNSLTYNDDIRSWLLLDSDLGGSIPDPDFFFADNSEKRKYLLDALMLTHGWRRFVWVDMLDKKTNKVLEYRPEKGIMISGKTTKFNEEFVPKKAMASMTLFGKGLVHDEQQTNDEGMFSFGPYIFADSISGIVQAFDSLAKRKFKQKHYSIFLDSPWPKVNVKNNKQEKLDRRTLIYNTEYLKESYQKKVADFKYDPRVTHLNEVVVTDKKKTRRAIINEIYDAEQTSGLFSRRVYRDSIPGSGVLSAMDLLARMPGVWITGTFPDQRVILPGGPKSLNAGSNPLVLIDGMQTDISLLKTLRAPEISFIDVVWGSDTALWGSRGAGGVIAIYTERGYSFDKEDVAVPGIVNFEIPGFYKVREFYTPNYAEHKPEYEKPDYRTTLFWQPNLKIDKDGKTSIDFYTGDSPGSYLVKVEGMTDDGRPVSGLHSIEIHEPN